jgi:hypothetical protein
MRAAVVKDVIGFVSLHCVPEVRVEVCVPIAGPLPETDLEVEVDSAFNTEPCNTKSASCYGDHQFHVVYSDYNGGLDDCPLSAISDLELTLEAAHGLQRFMDLLKADARFENVGLMSPAARSRDGDNHVFCVGFDVVETTDDEEEDEDEDEDDDEDEEEDEDEDEDDDEDEKGDEVEERAAENAVATAVAANVVSN